MNYAVKHRELHLKFRDLLAKCYRDANMRGCGVAGSSSSSSSNKRMRSTNAAASSGVTGMPAVLLLHRQMASLVRDKLIEQAIADVQQRDRLQKTNLGWRMAWGVVDRALAGMDFFRGNFHLPFAHYPPLPHSCDSGMRVGDDEAAMLRCFHYVQDLFLAGTLSSLLSSY